MKKYEFEQDGKPLAEWTLVERLLACWRNWTTDWLIHESGETA